MTVVVILGAKGSKMDRLQKVLQDELPQDDALNDQLTNERQSWRQVPHARQEEVDLLVVTSLSWLRRCLAPL